MTKSEIIESITSCGIPLIRQGVAHWALTRDQALSTLCDLLAANVGVLAGDMYQFSDGVLVPNGDCWYFERFSDESEVEFSRRTVNSTAGYILDYHHPGGGDIYFSLIFEGLPNG